MSDNVCTVDVCDRPAGDGFVCRDCLGILRQCLDDMPLLVDQLEIVMSRQAQYGVRSNGGGGKRPKAKSTPLMFDVRASDVLRDVHGVLGSWAKMLAEENGWDLPDDTTVAISAWLWRNLETIRTHDAGGDMVAEVSARKADALHAIDRPAEKWFAGQCSSVDDSGYECEERLYVVKKSGVVKCPRCNTQHDVAERREVLLKTAEDVLATASEAARAVVVWSDYENGESRLVKRIGMWVERKRIEPRGSVMERGRPRPLYRIGDILNLLADETRRESAA